jgi:putative membrane protein
MNFIVKILLSSFSVVVASWILSGIEIRDYFSALMVAFVLAILNTFLKPILVIFTIPITVLTFGIFLLVINALIALLAGSIVPGFYIAGFWAALWFSLIVSILNYLINLDDSKKRRNYR